MKGPALFTLCLALAAGPIAAADPKASADDLQAIATRFVDRLAAGDFATAVKSFDPAMTAALPADKLREVWKTLNTQAGVFQKRAGARAASESGFQVICVACKFEKATLEAKVVFDAQKRIAGLFFVPPPGAAEYTPPGYANPGTFSEAEVRVGGGAESLPGTLSLPAGADHVPGIVLVHGSGPLDRDETIGPNRPFRDLALGLASRGVAVLRYDKRTKVHGARLLAQRDRLTLQEETVTDAVEAARLLRRSPRVDGTRVFILGHSLGGVALPRIAALEPGLAGFVMLATPSRPLQEVYAEQMAYLFALDGVVTDQERAELESIHKQVLRVSAAGPETAGASEDLPLGLSRAYWDDLRRHSAAEAATDLRAPVLVLQGGRDYQVTRADLEGWRIVMASRSDVTCRLYPSLNHLFMEGEGKGTPDEYRVAGHVAPEVVEDLAAWLKQRPAVGTRRT
jgi:dienelactone hydrolase